MKSSRATDETGHFAMLLQQLTLQNLLSFGETPCVVPLRPLNVLIGPNGSGKSNFIEALALLQAAPVDVAAPVRAGGGVLEWIWKPNREAKTRTARLHPEVQAMNRGLNPPQAMIEVVVWDLVEKTLRHSLRFMNRDQSFALVGEQIEITKVFTKDGMVDVNQLVYQFSDWPPFGGGPTLVVDGEEIKLSDKEFDSTRSILAQRRDPKQFSEITYLGEQYEQIQIYREWAFGRETSLRLPQRADQRNDRLAANFQNLGLMVNRLRRDPEIKKRLLESMNDLYTDIDDIDVRVEGNTVQVFFHEGMIEIPATRLSDGTLRYLCLLVILLQPNPPPLVCIEEPELGLHPDVLPGLADLLREASQRMQLVVTTHSDILVDALSDTPEDIVICEKHDGATTMRRLDRNDLSVWLEKYSLGELWRRGTLGGNRW